ncbi:MAG: cytochrome b/b6 domain-containing protein, partial [bacterium]|nr:cytochrome b/b6 domain-containing protein [bacterium]
MRLPLIVSVLCALVILAVPVRGELVPPREKQVVCLGCHDALRGENHLDAEKYGDSVHGQLNCVECHDSRSVGAIDSVHRESVSSPGHSLPVVTMLLRDKTRFPDALAACGHCHDAVFADVRESVHGQALFERGNHDAAFCTDCHRPIHELKKVAATTSSVARTHLIETCSRCHANRVIASRYNLNVYVVQSYKAHFHGKKYSLGSSETPTCVACHGHHTASTVTAEEKLSICVRCHEGATAEFAAAFTHQPFNAESNPIAFHVRRILVAVLAAIVLLLTLHILLDLYGQFGVTRTSCPLPHARADISWSLLQRLPKQVERMDLHFRIQHAVVFVAIFYLSASGIALKFPEMSFSAAWIRLWGGVENAGHLHRFAALVLIIDVVYHLAYVALLRARKKLAFTLLPRVHDFRLMWDNIRYLAGRTSQRPAFGKFNYVQKLDYWLVVLVVVGMVVTGLMYWFPTVTAQIVPASASPWIWGLAYVVHSTEALLVLFVAFVWHFYN